MDMNKLIGIGLLVVIFMSMKDKPAPPVNPNKPAVVVTEPTGPVRVEADALWAKMTLHKKAHVARDLAGFYTELRSSVARDTEGKVYPTLAHFRTTHTLALKGAYQQIPEMTNLGFDVGVDVNRVLQASIGTLNPVKVDAEMRAKIVNGLDAVIWGLQKTE